MPLLALLLYLLYLGTAFVGRIVIQRMRTGTTGFRGLGGSIGSPEWLGGVLFVLAFAGGVAAPLLALGDDVEPIAALDKPWIQWTGVALFAIGLVATLIAQEAMGRSWRVGVDASERTELVTKGPFEIVRNPIYASMLPTVLGLVFLVPSVVALVAFAALITALEIQTRLVEEPHLLRTHGDAYARYSARVGRFFPGVGTR